MPLFSLTIWFLGFGVLNYYTCLLRPEVPPRNGTTRDKGRVVTK
ncbi:hypothetical protein SLEP1_g22271 [Rubroshorea leprosula]|uniref:ATP synthase F0 subunit 8 n=1 Tax=Rubroshorea leprosula TaxID=152421 RepID=A0AAV5JEQ6_9ROSI|nr:hypothetical protein SLEP1_g22271 [Rubroshorea leprosula]